MGSQVYLQDKNEFVKIFLNCESISLNNIGREATITDIPEACWDLRFNTLMRETRFVFDHGKILFNEDKSKEGICYAIIFLIKFTEEYGFFSFSDQY